MTASGDGLVIAVLGLGEAGSAIAADLLAAGGTVRAFDPAVPAPDGSVQCDDDADAARGAQLVLSVNSAADAEPALRAAADAVAPDAIWADLNTAAPATERQLGEFCADRGIAFADASLMAPVPGKGLRTPMLVSGTGARRYESLLTPLGARIEVLDEPAGAAAQRKLLRSVFFKGTAAAVTEALRAARAAGLEDWMRDMIAVEFASADEQFARRLEEGSVRHAVRREHEMTAAVELLTELHVPPRIAAASRDWLADLSRDCAASR